MADHFDDKDSEQLDWQRYWAFVRRRHMHILIPFFLGWLAVWAASWVLPPRYRSGTLILVEQPAMPKDYVTPNLNDDLQGRMQSITQQILSRTRLLRIIEGNQLYADAQASVTPDDQVERMRKDIEIELVRDGQGRVNAFNIYYTSRDPHMAQQVTSALSDLFINENLEVRQRQSEDNTKFLEGQMESARHSLAEQEEKIREFKGQHIGELPGQLGSNLQILSGLQSQLRTEEEALNTAKQQRAYLQSLADQYRSLGGSSPAGEGGPVGLAAVDQDLHRMKAQLADLSSHYTDRHPDVRKLQQQIATTQKLREQLVAAAQNAGSDTTTEATVQSPMLAQLQGQLRSNQIELTNRERSIADLKTRINDYQSRLNQEPIREQRNWAGWVA